MDEFEFIRSIQPSYYKNPSLLKGGGDDAAVFRQPSCDIVTAVDTFVENVHFNRETMTPFHVGYRALAANISDMAAMRAEPVFYLISIVVPSEWQQQELTEIYQGMKAIAEDYHMDLIGGDTVSGSELCLSVTIIGYSDWGKASYRNHARDQDIVFATGTLGDSRAGLYLLTHPSIKIENRDFFIKRHQLPSPRVSFIKELSAVPRLSLNDISDGIGSEATEIAEASNVTIHLRDEEIPIHPSFQNFTEEQQREWKLFGGEDFELVGTVPEKDWILVQKAAEKTGIEVSRIGYVKDKAETNGRVVLETGAAREILKKSGYTHLK